MSKDYNKVAVVVFDSHLHEISIPGSHYTIVVPGATNAEVADLLETAEVSVWNGYYITKAVRVLREAGYQPIVLDGLVAVTPHDCPQVYTVDEYYPHDEGSKGMDDEVEEIDEDE